MHTCVDNSVDLNALSHQIPHFIIHHSNHHNPHLITSQSEKNCLTQFHFHPRHRCCYCDDRVHIECEKYKKIYTSTSWEIVLHCRAKTSRGRRRRRNHKIKQSSTFSWVMTIENTIAARKKDFSPQFSGISCLPFYPQMLAVWQYNSRDGC